MSGIDYEERAEYCRQQTTVALTRDLRTRWLKLAEVWLELAIETERSFQATVGCNSKGRSKGHRLARLGA